MVCAVLLERETMLRIRPLYRMNKKSSASKEFREGTKTLRVDLDNSKRNDSGKEKIKNGAKQPAVFLVFANGPSEETDSRRAIKRPIR